MKKFRISPRLYDVPAFVEAESKDAAIEKVLGIVGHASVDHLNDELYDGSGIDDYLSVVEVSPDYIAALKEICADPIMKDVSNAMLQAKQEWNPSPETEAAIKRAVEAAGVDTVRKACNRIMGDMQKLGIPAADWSWIAMMKIHGEPF